MIRVGLALLLAGPASAGCFTAEEPPKRAIYEDGSAVEYLDHAGDVLTYRSGQVTTRIQGDLWPLDHRGEGFAIEYQWEGDLPDLARVIEAGGMAEVRGRIRRDAAEWEPVVAEVEVLGESTLDWEDCRYRVVEFRKMILVGEEIVSEGVLVYAPGAMISFSSDSIDRTSGRTYSYALEALE